MLLKCLFYYFINVFMLHSIHSSFSSTHPIGVFVSYFIHFLNLCISIKHSIFWILKCKSTLRIKWSVGLILVLLLWSLHSDLCAVLDHLIMFILLIRNSLSPFQMNIINRLRRYEMIGHLSSSKWTIVAASELIIPYLFRYSSFIIKHR